MTTRPSHRLRVIWLGMAVVLCAWTARAQSIMLEQGEEFEPTTLLLPYAFYNESIEFGAGPAFTSNGFLQDQMSLVVTGYASTSGSWAAFLLGRDIDVPLLDRLFLHTHISVASLEEFDSYVDGNPGFPNERAGSNESSEDNFITANAKDEFARFTFHYLLPLGHGEDTVINTYVLDRGLLAKGATGAKNWNPLESGRTYLEVEPFWRSQDIESGPVNADLDTNGVRFGVRWDNRDFAPNPSRGSQHKFSITRDWGKLSSSAPWTTIETEHDFFIPLGTPSWLRQNTLGLHFWTADTPTWDSGTDPEHRPPLFAGATLGGLFRLRGFADSRFYDKAAILYTAELRMTPNWNPLADSFLRMDWLQIVPFVEVGRVSPSWNFDDLHTDMKWDAGLGLRAMVGKLVIRIDTAFSDEGVALQMMVGQPF